MMVLRMPDLRALVAACTGMGLEFVSGRKRFRYSTFNSDQLPEWVHLRLKNGKGLYTPDHLIRIQNRTSGSKENSIGVYEDPDGHFILVADLEKEGGRALSDHIGQDGLDLLYAYRIHAIRIFARDHCLLTDGGSVLRSNIYICRLQGDDMTRRIQVRVKKGGALEAEILEGVAGPSCATILDKLRSAVGGTLLSTETKPEYYQQEIEVPADIRQGA